MFDSLIVALLSVAVGSPGIACPEDASTSDYHLSDVCSKYLEGAPAYSATSQASLISKPASQQVMVYFRDGSWFIRIAGYRWERPSVVVTRRNDIAISDVDAETIVSRLTTNELEALSALPYYGSDDVICLDGGHLELAMATAGSKLMAAQHTCAGKTEINEIAAMFRDLAIKYDPGSEGLLHWLRN